MRKLIAPLAVLAAVVPAVPLFGKEDAAAEATNTLAENTTKAAMSLFQTLKQAMTGDMDAVAELGSRFLIPATIAVVVALLGYFVASFIGRVVGGTVARRVDVTLGKFLGKAIRNGLMILILLGVLGYFGVDVTSFAAIIAAMGFAVGMALQGTLGNFAAGVMLLVFRPFKVGEYIQVGGEEGTVEEIDLFTTRLNTPDNLHKIVPNGQIFGSTITNYTHNEFRRVAVTVGAEYGADIDYTRAVLQAAISEIPGAVAQPAPQVVLTELADSSVNWQLRVWCQPGVYWDVRELLLVAAKKGLDLNGIGIPFPQIDIHLPGNAEQGRKAA